MGYFLGGITLTCFFISSYYVVCALSVFSFKKSSMKEEYKSNFIIGIIGKTYSPDSSKVIVYQGKRDPGGSASVRNEEKDGRNKNFQRNHYVVQVFSAIKDFDLMTARLILKF